MITDRDGQIPWPSDKGLYFFDTRLISSWSIYANGENWELLNAGNSPITRRAYSSLIVQFSLKMAISHRGHLGWCSAARSVVAFTRIWTS
jgi:glycogen debranching enzyme-like protein